LFTYAPFMQTWFNTRALHPAQLLLCALVGLAVLVLLELEKALLRWRSAEQPLGRSTAGTDKGVG
jgi:hypothetical protein